MKNISKKIFTAILSLFLVLLSQADIFGQCEGGNVLINEKIRYLSDFDTNGRPLNIIGQNIITDSIKDYIMNVIPEGVSLPANRPELLSEDLQFNTILTDSAEVFLTFVLQSAGWINSLGFYTFDVQNPPQSIEEIDSLIIIFPKIQQGNAIFPGDKVSLGRFGPQTGLGYFLVAEGWNEATGTVCPDKHLIFTDKRFNTFSPVGFRQHTVLLGFAEENALIVGMEDNRRPGGDQDFNDLVFYVTAEPNALDTVMVPELPRALLAGDTTLCSPNDMAELTIEFKGPGPYEIIYSNGTDVEEIKGIDTPLFSFETSMKGEIVLTSVRNRFGAGIINGGANVQLVGTFASFDSSFKIDCDTEFDEIEVPVNFSGIGPWTLTYQIDDLEPTIIQNIELPVYNIQASTGNLIKLLSIQDEVCLVDLDQEILIDQFSAPKLNLESEVFICEPILNAFLPISFEGNAPFTIGYTFNGISNDTTVNENQLILEFNEAGIFEITSFSDAFCIGAGGQTSEIILKSAPSAAISGNSVICEDETAFIEISLSGTAPFTLVYARNGEEETTLTTSENMVTLNPTQKGTFTLLSISDAFCEGTVSGEATVSPATSAEVDANFKVGCEDEGTPVDVPILLTGAGNWELVYKIDDNEFTQSAIESNIFIISANVGQTISLIQVSDVACTTQLEQVFFIESFDAPELLPFENESDLICEIDGNYSLPLNFSGKAPFYLKYTFNGVESDTTFNSNQGTIILTDAGEFELIFLEDANCEGSAGQKFILELFDTPTASLITSDQQICPGEEAELELNFSGTGPWSFVIAKNGVSGEVITTDDNTFIFKTKDAGIYTIASAGDVNCTAQISGEAFVNFYETSAAIAEDFSAGCSPVGSEIEVPVILKGSAPWTLTYKVGSQVIEASGITDDTFMANGIAGGDFELISVSDENCTVSLDQKIEVIISDVPELSIANSATLCENEDGTEISINLSGQAPFVIEYDLNGTVTELSTSDDVLVIMVTEPGVLQILSFRDNLCEGEAGQRVNIINKPAPIALISGNESICEGETASLKIALSGNTPWSVTYTDGVEEYSINSSNGEVEIITDKAGNYSLISVSDAFCTGSVSGSAEVIIKPLPTAIISGGGDICGDETATVAVDFTGTAPWTLVILENGEEKTYTTIDNQLLLETSLTTAFNLVSISDLNCSAPAEGTAEVNNLFEDLNARLEGPDVTCFGDEITIRLVADGVIDQVNWSATGTGSIVSFDNQEMVYLPSEGQTGLVSISAEISNTCGTQILSFEVMIKEELLVNILLPDEKILVNTSYPFTADNLNLTGYIWDFGDDKTASGNQVFHQYDNTGIYEIRLNVEDEDGCSAEASVEIEVFIIDQLYIPNAFSPYSSNPENRTLKVYGENIDENDFSFTIVNRWGKIMYQTSSFAEANLNGWDGRAVNAGDEKALNVFSWIVKGKFSGGDDFEIAGTVTLVK
ncbi:MAG: DUF4114 domain-containing protein [Cyclobacteriaceae bacterium]|nr:DUF4114 domain-containing protein [Cyclobacteriaceae bacterium]